jgi:hypothetical protein
LRRFDGPRCLTCSPLLTSGSGERHPAR